MKKYIQYICFFTAFLPYIRFLAGFEGFRYRNSVYGEAQIIFEESIIFSASKKFTGIFDFMSTQIYFCVKIVSNFLRKFKNFNLGEKMMNVSLSFSRVECIEVIGKEEIKQITRASIEHFAIPLIAGISMDEISQRQYEEMGGRGNKPEPLSPKTKLEIYIRIKNFFKDEILRETTNLVNSVLDQSLETLSDEELLLKVVALNDKIEEEEPNWKRLPELFKDHTCLFKDLEKRTNLKVNLISFHDKLCFMMCNYRDSGKLFSRIQINELL